MITAVRTASIHEGKIADAIAWALKVANHARSKLGSNTQVVRNIGGPIYQIHWVSTYQSLAEMEAAVKKTEADEGYRTMLLEARQQSFFIASSIADSIYETIG